MKKLFAESSLDLLNGASNAIQAGIRKVSSKDEDLKFEADDVKAKIESEGYLSGNKLNIEF